MTNDVGPDDDEVLVSLAAVVETLHECRQHIAGALERAEAVAEARRAGSALADIFEQTGGDSVIELIAAMLAALSDTGGALRRAEARALYAEGLSMDKIAHVFGVSRQRVSSLLHTSRSDADEDTWTTADDAQMDRESFR